MVTGSQPAIEQLGTPEASPAEVTFENLFDLEEIQVLQDEFALATNVASIITHPDGTPITRPSNFCRLCIEIIRKTEKGCANCYKSDAALGKLCLDGPTIQPCMSGGLWDAGAGISVGGRHIANWLIGQVRDETQSEEAIRRYAETIGADVEDAAAAFNEVPAMTREQFEQVAQALFTLAGQLSETAYKNLQLRNFIREREESRAALRRNEDRFRNVFNATADALFIHDEQGNIIDVNDAMLAMYDMTKPEALASSIADDLSGPENDLAALDIFWKAVVAGEEKRFEWQAQRPKDGKCFPVHVTLRRVDVEGSHAILAVVRDMSEAKEAEAERIHLEEALHQSRKMDAIGQLAGGVAHDFNNMLGGIIGAAEMMERRLNKPQDLPRYLEMILTSAEQAARLTDKLLSFARKQTTVAAAISLLDPIEDALTILSRTMDRRITLERHYPKEPLMVVGDPAHLQSAFLNLLINATHAMPNGGTLSVDLDSVDLDLKACLAGSQELSPGPYARISFRDTGHGIDKEDLPRIFEPFFTTKDQGKGTGLGLAATYGVIQQHRGAIDVTSTPESGTTFTIHLPLTRASSTSVASLDKPAVSGQGHVLVVDDEPVMRETAKSLLEDIGYRVTVAEHGQEAVDRIRESGKEIDLVLLDMIMPVMNGRDCFFALRALQPELPIVLCSGFAQIEAVDDLVTQGLSGFIHKPFRSAELSRAIAAGLRGA